MTAFVTSDIPASVTTVEELAAWSCSILAELNPALSLQTSAAALETVAAVQTFDFQFQQENPERLVCLVYLPLLPTWRGTGKIWANGIATLSDTAIPAVYKQV